MKQLYPIMFAGTGSDVGKSIVAAAFCRIFKQDGYQPAPFKAQWHRLSYGYEPVVAETAE